MGRKADADLTKPQLWRHHVSAGIYGVNCNISIPQETEMCEGKKEGGGGVRKREKCEHAETFRTGEQRGRVRTAGKKLFAQKNLWSNFLLRLYGHPS